MPAKNYQKSYSRKDYTMRYLLALLLMLATFALAQTAKPAYTEQVKVGPYNVTVGFSRWPVQADRSFDLIFDVDGGVADKEGTVTLLAPTSREVDARDHDDFFNYPFPLSRFARDRTVWGFDVIAFPEEGQWTYEFVIDGPQGQGTGSLDVVFLERPAFLPSIVNWSLGFIPLIALIILMIVSWLRVKPSKRAETWTWNETA
jgi:hypothetical protein